MRLHRGISYFARKTGACQSRGVPACRGPGSPPDFGLFPFRPLRLWHSWLLYSTKHANLIQPILVGDFIDSDFEKSLLYDKKFSHMYRDAEDSK